MQCLLVLLTLLVNFTLCSTWGYVWCWYRNWEFMSLLLNSMVSSSSQHQGNPTQNIMVVSQMAPYSLYSALLLTWVLANSSALLMEYGAIWDSGFVIQHCMSIMGLGHQNAQIHSSSSYCGAPRCICTVIWVLYGTMPCIAVWVMFVLQIFFPAHTGYLGGKIHIAVNWFIYPPHNSCCMDTCSDSLYYLYKIFWIWFGFLHYRKHILGLLHESEVRSMALFKWLFCLRAEWHHIPYIVHYFRCHLGCNLCDLTSWNLSPRWCCVLRSRVILAVSLPCASSVRSAPQWEASQSRSTLRWGGSMWS